MNPAKLSLQFAPRGVTRAVILFLIGLSLAFADSTRAGGAPAVVQFSPRGTIKNVRQVTARFSEPMVPLGDPRASAPPFAIECAEKGASRWIDSRNWAYDFARDLPAGVRCTFTLRADLKTLSGASFSDHPKFSFDTGGPSIVNSDPWDGQSDIYEDQAFILTLDAEPEESSIHEDAGFSVSGMPARIDARIVSGAERDALAKRFKRTLEGKIFVILQAKQNFPNGAEVRLVWGKGIRTRSGIATVADQVLKFKTRKPFEAAFRCSRDNPRAACDPLMPMEVTLTEAISPDAAKGIALTGADGTRYTRAIDEADESEIRVARFRGPFKPSSQYKLELPPNLNDDSGRALSNASRFPMTVATDAYPPLAKFSARFGILESADPVLPVTLRNVEAQLRGSKLKLEGGASGLIGKVEATLWRVPAPDAKSVLEWLRRVAAAKRAESVFAEPGAHGAREFSLPKPNGPNAFEVIGVPLKHRGLYVVELKSTRLGSVLLGENKPMYVPTAALVTNLSVHFKKGHDNSLVWVTTLERAQPVEGAHVAIADCNGIELWHGTTDRRGLAVAPELKSLIEVPHCAGAEPDYSEPDAGSEQNRAIRDLNNGVLVTASHGDDFSFVHSSWQYGIEPWRFQLPVEYRSNPLTAHTVLDRSLLRAGETVHMKHFIRRRSLDGFAYPRAADLPDHLTLTRVGSEDHYDFDLAWDARGTAVTTWKIPAGAKLGAYEIAMSRRKPGAPREENEYAYDETRITSGSFRVEEFRIPLMKAAIRMPSAPAVAVTEIPLDLSASYLSGGAARGLPVTLRSQLDTKAYPHFPDFDRFQFANGAVKEGVEKVPDWEETTESEESAGVHQRKDLVLDASGGARAEITAIPRETTPIEVRAEMEYRDPSGETQTVANTITVWPARRLAGIMADDWASSPGEVKIRAAVVDDGGKPVANAPVRIELFSRKRYSYRKRLIGGFFAYENSVETRSAGQLCSGNTDSHGLFLCETKPPITGETVVQATVADDGGNTSSANTDLFIPGATRFWFEGRDDDRMDVLPEKPQYEPGETARFQVRMPFEDATALVTVEREGVIASSVLHVSGKQPLITIPVRDSYAPNVFVSVLAVRGRIGNIQPTAMLDLGKPAFRLGIAEIRVGWRAHRLSVTVTPERSVYRVREKARVKIAVRTAAGSAPPAGSTAAIAAVDEGLLELKPNDSWKLLDAMMGRRAYEVETATAQMQVVGKRHFGLKALPPGGGGGRAITRTLFDTLLMWNPSVPLDEHGDATVEVPLNDSLTSFRIVAIASAGAAMFGTGAATIRSTQDLQILSGISPVIRTGDSFLAEFTIRNASERAFEATVAQKIEGLNQSGTQKIALGAGEGKALTWNVSVPAAVGELKYSVDASVEHGPSDHVIVTQRVIPATPVRTYQATLVRLDKPADQPIEQPKDALKGQGGIQVALSPSLVAGLDGVRDWMRDYPYTCLEQRVSRAVALNDPKLWNSIVADLPSYTDADGLLKYFPSMRLGSDVLTSYVLSITNEAGMRLPPAAEENSRKGLRGFVEGKITRDEFVIAADLPLRKLAAIEALSRYEKIEPGLLGSITIDPNLWPDSAVLDWWSIVLRAPAIPNHDQQLEQAEQIMRARLNAQGTAYHLSTDSRNDLWWLMASPARNMGRLVLLLVDNKLWTDDAPKVMAGAVAMQTRGSWGSTIANAWGTLAVKKFAAAFESQAVGGVTEATLNAGSQKLDWGAQPSGGVLGFAWPDAAAALHVAHSGSGSPWAQIRANAAIPLTQAFSSGYRITKTITPVESNHGGGWRQGDMARVHLKIDAQSDMTWVVVNDPIPAGASQLGGGLNRQSQIALSGEKPSFEQEVWPAFVERGMDSYRAYYEYVPKGSFELEYTIRLNQVGSFAMPATRVEALYEPEMLGEAPNARFEVAP